MLKSINIPYSTKFLWHNIFMDFVIRRPSRNRSHKNLELYTIHIGRGFKKRNHEIFSTKINIRVTFNVFAKFFDHEIWSYTVPYRSTFISWGEPWCSVFFNLWCPFTSTLLHCEHFPARDFFLKGTEYTVFLLLHFCLVLP